MSAGAVGLPHNRVSRRALQALFFVAGLAFAAWLVHSVGLERIGRVVVDAGPWLPLIILFEAAFITCDAVATRVLIGPAARGVKAWQWIRSTAAAYASAIILPAGRAAAEAARATVLAPVVGTPRAAGAGSRMQACALTGNGVVSLIAAVALLGSGSSETTLVLGLFGNAIVCGLLSLAVLLLARSKRVRAFVRKRFARLVEAYRAPDAAPPNPSATLGAMAICTFGRLVQAAEYGAILHSVKGSWSVLYSLSAQGIHLVGAAIGDFIPNQLGATEGAFWMFASALELGGEPARAVSIAVVARVAQVLLASVCLVVASIRGR